MTVISMDDTNLNSASAAGEDLAIEGTVGGPYTIDKILGIYMGKDKKKYFRVKWNDSWEPEENLSESCQDLIDDFWSGKCNSNNSMGEEMLKANLKLGQKILKVEDMDYSEENVINISGCSKGDDTKLDVSSSSEQRVDVSSSNDGKSKKSSQRKTKNKNVNLQSSNENNHRDRTSTRSKRNLESCNAKNINLKNTKNEGAHTQGNVTSSSNNEVSPNVKGSPVSESNVTLNQIADTSSSKNISLSLPHKQGDSSTEILGKIEIMESEDRQDNDSDIPIKSDFSNSETCIDSYGKIEGGNEATAINSSTLNDINTVPVKMISPTSVVPVEATSTIQDEVDTYEAKDLESLPSSAKKQLNFSHPDNVLENGIGNSVDLVSDVEGDISGGLFKSPPKKKGFVYKDKHNVMYSSPPQFSEIEDYEDVEYSTDFRKRKKKKSSRGKNVDSFTNPMINEGNDYFTNFISSNSEEYGTNNFMDSNQYNDSLIGDNDSQPDDIIKLDSEDELEFIVSIESPQNRPRGRLSRSRKKAVSSCPSRGAGAVRGNRGRQAQPYRLPPVIPLMNRPSITNDNRNAEINLVHPRALLNSPQNRAEDPTTPSPQRKRGMNQKSKDVTTVRNISSCHQEASPNRTPKRRQKAASQRVMSNIEQSPSNEMPNMLNVTPPSKKQALLKSNSLSESPIVSKSPSTDHSPSRLVLNDRYCTICNHSFPNLTLARQHAKQVHGNQVTPSKGLTCQACKAIFNTNKDLKSHMLLHSDHTVHKCEVCFRVFKQRSVLNQHMLIHSEELPYLCSLCGKRFRQQGHLILHLGTHGRNNEGTYKCPHCRIEFNDENLFSNHMREHDSDLPFKCNFCQQRFELKINLISHLEGHNEGRPHTCHICKKSFKTKTYYIGHMQMHKIRDSGSTGNVIPGKECEYMEESPSKLE